MIIDLHIHSNCSDGDLSPKEIIDIAQKNGVKYISITDHDSVSAYNEEIFNYAKQKNITLISGIEISTRTNRCGIHILGYNFDLNNEILKKTLQNAQNSRKNYLFDVSKKLTELGYKINTDDLKNINSVGKSHVAKNIINNEENKNQLLKTFNHIPSCGEFIETILNEGCPGYVKKFSVTPFEASNIIKNAGGKVVLAHPVAYKHEDNLSLTEILNLIDEIKPDGLESNFIYISRNKEIINEIQHWSRIAKEQHLISTIGSDFHKSDSLHAEIGFTNYPLTFFQSDLTQLLNLLSIK